MIRKSSIAIAKKYSNIVCAKIGYNNVGIGVVVDIIEQTTMYGVEPKPVEYENELGKMPLPSPKYIVI